MRDETRKRREAYLSEKGSASQHISWYYASFEIPALWELSAHQKSPGNGKLVFRDFDGETLQFQWRRIKKSPNIRDRICALVMDNIPDAVESQVKQDIVESNDWTTYYPRDKAKPVFAGTFNEDEKALLLFSFASPKSGYDKTCIERIIDSYEPNPIEDGVFEIFGMRMTRPDGYDLVSMNAQPACQQLRFENRKEEYMVFTRYGMDTLLIGDHDLAVFGGRVKGGNLTLHNRGDRQHNGSPGVHLEYSTRGRGFFLLNLLTRAWPGHFFIFHDAPAKRIYTIEHHCMTKSVDDELLDKLSWSNPA